MSIHYPTPTTSLRCSTYITIYLPILESDELARMSDTLKHADTAIFHLMNPELCLGSPSLAPPCEGHVIPHHIHSLQGGRAQHYYSLVTECSLEKTIKTTFF